MSDSGIFVARDGQEIGPFTENELLRAIAAGRYGKGDFIWIDSAGDWQPLESVQPFARQIGHSELLEPVPTPNGPAAPAPVQRGDSAPLAEPPPAVLVAAARPEPAAQSGELLRPGDRSDLSQRRPFVRYAARLLDMAIFSFLSLGIAGALGLRLGADQALLLEVFLLALYVPVEAFVLGSFGTTPGKAFLRVQVVREDGAKLDLATAMNRAVMVWWRGWGIGVPIVSLVCLILGFSKLISEGRTTWDRDLKLRVIHGPVGLGRGIIVLLMIMFLFGSSMGQITQQAMRVS